MKLSNKTISILKSMNTINIGMVMPAGKMIQVESEPRDIFVRCDIEEEFTQEFGIYDMPAFINTINMFDDPDLDFQADRVAISSGRNAIDYHYVTDKSYIAHGDWLDIKDDAYVLTFDLSEDDIKNIQKASSIMGLDQLEFTNNDGKIICTLISKAKDTKNRYAVELSDCDKKLDFKLVMRVGENFRFYEGDYQIRIAEIQGHLVFCATNTDINLQYQVALDRTSVYK